MIGSIQLSRGVSGRTYSVRHRPSWDERCAPANGDEADDDDGHPDRCCVEGGPVGRAVSHIDGLQPNQ